MDTRKVILQQGFQGGMERFRSLPDFRLVLSNALHGLVVGCFQLLQHLVWLVVVLLSCFTKDQYGPVLMQSVGNSGRQAGLALVPDGMDQHPRMFPLTENTQDLLDLPSAAHKLPSVGHRYVLILFVQKGFGTFLRIPNSSLPLSSGQYSAAPGAQVKPGKVPVGAGSGLLLTGIRLQL